MNNNKIFFTFDVDWVCDEVLEYLNKLIEKTGIYATICMTHKTDVIEVFRTNPKIELAIHPNFMDILDNRSEDDYRDRIRQIKEIIPEAITVRTHGLIDGTMILREFANQGIKNEMNLYIPLNANAQIMPFSSNGICRFPFVYEDDLFLWEKMNELNSNNNKPYKFLNNEFNMLPIFNFHPIHLFLNSECLQRYENAKRYTRDYNKLKEYRNTTYEGVEDWFFELVEEANRKGYESFRICDWNNS